MVSGDPQVQEYLYKELGYSVVELKIKRAIIACSALERSVVCWFLSETVLY